MKELASSTIREEIAIIGMAGHFPGAKDIDEFWHQHILDTKKYRDDCKKIFGEYFDHYPYFGIDEKSNYTDLENAFTKMQELYAKEFNGAEIYQVKTLFTSTVAFFKKLFRIKPARVSATQGL